MTPHQRGFKSYWSSPGAPMSLGCLGCPDIKACGGQTINGHGFNCLDHCCGRPENCAITCPKSNSFIDRVREVAGLNLTVPVTPALSRPTLPKYVPLIFHGSARNQQIAVAAASIPLYRFFNNMAECRFTSRTDLCAQFKLDPRSDIILSGVARDSEVERWWSLQRNGRLQSISNLRRLGITMVTTPNFSVIVDRPRWDDLHSMKRIAEVYHEFISEGVNAALHVNGRTDRDFQRWAEFIVEHEEVTHLAFEFTTGNKTLKRMKQHTAWLIWLAKAVGRRLSLIIRGGIQVVGLLAIHYDVTFLDSSPFEKAQHRFIADIGSDGKRRWISQQTGDGEPIDELFSDNVRLSELWFDNLYPKISLAA